MEHNILLTQQVKSLTNLHKQKEQLQCVHNELDELLTEVAALKNPQKIVERIQARKAKQRERLKSVCVGIRKSVCALDTATL